MAVLCNVCKIIRLLSVGEREFNRVFGIRLISTCNTASKSRPSTVGVPAWAKAANKRQAQVLLLEKKKTPTQMQAEVRLADVKSNKSDFLTTSRVGVHKPKEKTTDQANRMTLSTSGEMFVFYHAKQDYPVQHSKAVNTIEIPQEDSSSNDNTNSLSESQVVEIKLLQRRDPKLWTVDVLSDMYKVNPLAIINAAPLSPDQQLHLEVEQDFLATLSDYEKKEYSYFKNNERRKQLQKIGKNKVK
ncbi:Hypothetical predicted protein [Paramuricea clavata]|uniref:Uncharacterized protein n=1 Tax=Paramuricea clavata TaxID=317549 RepID=A0A6S7G7N9_PARCT|nr:Hypothetical predicted protein [Paramuricea clavata]